MSVWCYINIRPKPYIDSWTSTCLILWLPIHGAKHIGHTSLSMIDARLNISMTQQALGSPPWLSYESPSNLGMLWFWQISWQLVIWVWELPLTWLTTWLHCHTNLFWEIFPSIPNWRNSQYPTRFENSLYVSEIWYFSQNSLTID